MADIWSVPAKDFIRGEGINYLNDSQLANRLLEIAEEYPIYFLTPSDNRFVQTIHFSAGWMKAVEIANNPENLRSWVSKHPTEALKELKGWSADRLLRMLPQMREIAAQAIDQNPPTEAREIVQFGHYLRNNIGLVARAIEQNPDLFFATPNFELFKVTGLSDALKSVAAQHPLLAFQDLSKHKNDASVLAVLDAIPEKDFYEDVRNNPLRVLSLLRPEYQIISRPMLEKSPYKVADSAIPEKFRKRAEQIALTPSNLIEDAGKNPYYAFNFFPLYAASPQAEQILTASLRDANLATRFYGEYPKIIGHLKNSKVSVDALDHVAYDTLSKALSGPKAHETALRIVQTINALHTEGDDVRLRAVQKFSAQQLFQLIGNGREEIFTSSFNKIFDKLIPQISSPQQKQDFFDAILSGDNKILLPAFLEASSSYRRINQLFQAAPNDDIRAKLVGATFDALKDSISVRADNGRPNLKFAVMLTDTMLALSGHPEFKDILGRYEAELMRRFNEAPLNSDLRKALGLAASAYVGAQSNPIHVDLFDREKLRQQFPIPDTSVLSEGRLFKDGTHRQRVVFYTDDDGMASFQHFMDEYKKDDRWTIEDRGSFVRLTTSRNGRTVEIVANKPDQLEGIEAVNHYYESNGVNPLSIVHRGHSYHTESTMPYIKGDLAFVSWGSCGGYQLATVTAQRVPGAHISGTTGTGAMAVNDPLEKAKIDAMLDTGQINWREVWQTTEKAIASAGEKTAIDLFNGYQRPDQNFGSIFSQTFDALPPELERRGDISQSRSRYASIDPPPPIDPANKQRPPPTLSPSLVGAPVASVG